MNDPTLTPAAGSNDILSALMQVLAERRTASLQDSYVARLYSRGPERIHEKIAEEARELIEAVADATGNCSEVVHEAADLLFHTLVLLSWAGVTMTDVETELSRRFGVSGLQRIETE